MIRASGRLRLRASYRELALLLVLGLVMLFVGLAADHALAMADPGARARGIYLTAYWGAIVLVPMAAGAAMVTGYRVLRGKPEIMLDEHGIEGGPLPRPLPWAQIGRLSVCRSVFGDSLRIFPIESAQSLAGGIQNAGDALPVPAHYDCRGLIVSDDDMRAIKKFFDDLEVRHHQVVGTVWDETKKSMRFVFIAALATLLIGWVWINLIDPLLLRR